MADYDRLDLPNDLAGDVHDVRIGLWYPDSGQYYQAERTDIVDSRDRLQLGRFTELQRSR